MTGGKWFISVAIPDHIWASTAAVSVLVTLARKAKLIGLKLFAASLFAAALLPVLIEWRLNVAYGLHRFFVWALYPFVVLIILGAICLVIDKNAPLKEKLAQKFFL
jgi:xanthine/uracil permease